MAKKPTKDKTQKADEPPKVGRPSLYSETLISTICSRLAEGESLTQVCQDETMPAYGTIMRWLGEKPEFHEKYARACEIRGTLLFEECLKIADEAADPQKARLQFDARRWYLSKLVPKKYGDRLELAGEVKVEHKLADRVKRAKERAGK